MMIDETKFEKALGAYKKAFNASHWTAERYKWIAIKNFQDNWDINAEDFLTMFNKATDKANNLLTSLKYYPRGMIQEFIRVDKEAVRAAFINLFDESQSFESRIEKFTSDSDTLQRKYDKGFWHNHYQTHNAITTYLWLKYPDKYYIFKYSTFKNAASVLDSNYLPKKGKGIRNVSEAFKLYDAIRAKLKNDIELNELINSYLDAECYQDAERITLTVDFIYFLGTTYTINTTNQPYNTPSPLNSDVWRELLLDESFTNSTVKRYLKYWYDQPSHTASCKEISDKYGETPAVYNATLTQYAKKVLEKYNIVITGDDGEPVYWRAIMTGEYTKYNGQTVFEWTLRPEVAQTISRLLSENKYGQIHFFR